MPIGPARFGALGGAGRSVKYGSSLLSGVRRMSAGSAVNVLPSPVLPKKLGHESTMSFDFGSLRMPSGVLHVSPRSSRSVGAKELGASPGEPSPIAPSSPASGVPVSPAPPPVLEPPPPPAP